MTPKEKAQEIYNDFDCILFTYVPTDEYFDAEQLEEVARICARLCVNRMIDTMSFEADGIFWEEVRSEVKKIRAIHDSK